MTTQVFKTFGPGKDFTTVAALATYLTGLTCVASDIFVTIDCHADLDLTPLYAFGPATYSATQRVRLRPAAGLGVNDLERTTFNVGTSGIAITLANRALGRTVNALGVDIQGFRILVSGAGTGITMIVDGMFAYNRIYDSSTGGTGTRALFQLGGAQTNMVSDNLIVADGGTGKVVFYDGGIIARYQRNTYAARGAALNGLQAARADYTTGSTAVDEVYIGCDATILSSSIAATNCYANTTPTAGRVTGIAVNATAGALVVNEGTDLRPKAGGALIGAATAGARSTLDILGNNRGPAADVGAWQLAPAVPLPSGTITGVTVSGTTVTISGTTANSPASGMASLSASPVAGNNAVSQGPVAITLGTGTFSIAFSNVKVGRYDPSVTLTNAGGTAPKLTAGGVDVVGATGTLTAQALDGQVYSVSGTTTGNPTSGSITIPAAAANPEGAVAIGPVALTLGAGTFACSTALGVGNYDPAIINFTTAAGTSLPIPGTVALSVIGISGNPEAPPAPTAPARTASVSLVSADGTAIAAGASLRFAWFDQVTPDSFDAPTDKGSVAIGAGGMVRVPLTHSMKVSGEAGWLTVTNSDGSPDTVHKAFSGPVKVD